MDAEAEVHYRRLGPVVHFTQRGLNNHEVRAVIVGMAHRLDKDDRLDLIEELKHHEEPGNVLSEVSAAIANGEDRDAR